VKHDFLSESVLVLPFFLPLLFVIVSCSGDDPVTPPPAGPSATIAVFSDPHYFDPELGTSGGAFESHIATDRKLIAESHALTEAVTAQIIVSDADFVLVPGDLSKDGERSSHEKFAGFLRRMEQAGKEVFVVPGNHDVLNPSSVSFQGDNTVPVPNVTVQEFADIYAEFGYTEAIGRDPSSLSYVVEPVAGLRIIGMDACRYSENTGSGYPVTGGRFPNSTEAWIKTQIQTARSEGKTVFGLLHHGLLEHFEGQKVNPVSTDYVIEEWDRISKEFATLGMHIVFTGHYHANDIVRRSAEGTYCFDIETGSLVTWPSPWRLARLTPENRLEIRSFRLESIQFDTGGKSFQDYAFDYLESGMSTLSAYILQVQFGMSASAAQSLAPVVTGAIMAHYAGDEVMPPEARAAIDTLKSSGDVNSLFVSVALETMYTDLPPADNTIVIDLNSGTVLPFTAKPEAFFSPELLRSGKRQSRMY